jgi:hypothetical protein
MKIETYKCDVCGQMCNTTDEIFLPELGYRAAVSCRIDVQDRYGHKLDVCKRCLLSALVKILSEPDK